MLKKLSAAVFNEGYLDKLAKTTGAIKRTRKVSGSQLADLLLFEAGGSLNEMSMQLLLKHGVEVSKQGLHQRFSEGTISFMKSILDALLSVELPVTELQGLEIMIKDSTRFALPDIISEELSGLAGSGMKAGASVQFEFGLKSGKSRIGLTAANVNDQSESRRDQTDISSNEVYLRDLGYAHIGYMNNITECSAFFVNKLSPRTIIYIKHDDRFLELDLTLIDRTTDMQVYIGKQKFPVRLIIEPVDEKTKAARITRVNKYNKKKGLSTTNRFKLRSGYNIILTNLDKDEYDAALIQQLYRLRWQVELVFKAWKSMMQLHLIGKGCIHRTWCRLYGKLIWVMLGWKITMSVGRIGQVSLLKTYGLIASTRESLRQQLWKLSNRWLEMMHRIPTSRLAKEQRKGRLKTENVILSI